MHALDSQGKSKNCAQPPPDQSRLGTGGSSSMAGISDSMIADFVAIAAKII